MDITIKNLQTKIPIRPTRIKKVIRQTLDHFSISDAELSVVFVTAQRMKVLNSKYLKHDYATDILTFNYRTSTTKQRICAEIIICPSVAARNAGLYRTTIAKEIERYLVHGILHLAGYDDHSSRDIERMRKKETEILGFLKNKF